jgi:hypothetical protein
MNREAAATTRTAADRLPLAVVLFCLMRNYGTITKEQDAAMVRALPPKGRAQVSKYDHLLTANVARRRPHGLLPLDLA